MPLVSIIMGVYCLDNDTCPLECAIYSILKQSLINFEFIICDDGSSQSVHELLDMYAIKDSRIVLLRPGGIVDLSKKLNLCLSHCKGSFIARMDDDDYSYPDRLAKQLEYLIKHPHISFVGCNICKVYLNNERKCFYLPEFPEAIDFRSTMPFIHPALLFRKEALEQAEGYSEFKYCKYCEDYDLLLRLYYLGFKGANVQDILFDYSMIRTESRSRSYRYRINESIVRFLRFKELKLLPGLFLYVLRPLIVGMLPLPIRNWLRHKYCN